MHTKCYCWILVFCVLTGVWSTPVLSPEIPPDQPPEAVEPVKYYILKEKSTIGADSDTIYPTYSHYLTSGNIVYIRGTGEVKYSADSGATWVASTGLPAISNHEVDVIRSWSVGNEIWLLIQKDDASILIYKSTGGAIFAQYGSTLTAGGLGLTNIYPGCIIANVGTITTCLIILRTYDGATYDLKGYLWNAGTSTWNASGTISGAPDVNYQPPNTIIWNADDSKAYFVANSGSPAANKHMHLISWNAGSLAVLYSFTTFETIYNLQATTTETNLVYYNGFFTVSVARYNGAVYTNMCVVRNTVSGTYGSGWVTVIDQGNIVARANFLPRVWSYHFDITTTYTTIWLSHNNGYNFFPINNAVFDSNNTQITSYFYISSIVDISDSDKGIGVFAIIYVGGLGGTRTNKYFTFQEATWNDLFAEESLRLTVGSDPGVFKGLMDSASKTRFVDGMVLCIYDDAGNILFEGKVAFTEQDEGLFKIEALEISEELDRIKPVGTYTAQTAAQILVAMIDAECTFCYQSSSITSSATTYTIRFNGEKSLAQILDEFADLEDYIWYKAGDGKIIFDDGTTVSGVSYDATTDDFAQPKITSEGYKIANRIEGRGKVEADGPVFYAADDIDDQTRNGIWVHKFTQPTWGYDEVKACADNLLAARKAISDIFSMYVVEILTLRPGTTVTLSNFSTEFGIDDGTYLVMAIEHDGEGGSYLVLNNASITSKDWAREQEYAANAMKDLYTKPDITESASSSTEVPMEAEDEMLARILRHATSEANAVTIIYDATHSVKFWIDSSGNLQVKTVANAALVFDQPSGNALVYIKATGGAGTEDVWLYLDAEDDSAILFQENGATKGYVKWDKGLAGLIIDAAGNINLTPTGALQLNGNDIGAALMIGSANAAWVPCIFELEGNAGKVRTDGNIINVDATDTALQFRLPLPTNRGGLKLYVNRARIAIADADADDYVTGVTVYTAVYNAFTSKAGYTTDLTSAQQKTLANADLTSGALPADCSAGDSVFVWVELVCTTAGEVDINGVQLEVYYDT